MHKLSGRAYWRRRREYREAVDDTEVGIDYDAADLMNVIDDLPRGWRMLVNDHGFTAVMKARQFSTDINVVEKMLKQRHEARQQELANARY